MDSKDQAPVVVLALYAATLLPAIVVGGLGLGLAAVAVGVFVFVPNVGPPQDPFSLVWMAFTSVVSLCRFAAALGSGGFAVLAAWRLSSGDDRSLWAASLAALVASVLSAVSAVVTIDCCTAALWGPPVALALLAFALALQRGTTSQQWGGAA